MASSLQDRCSLLILLQVLVIPAGIGWVYSFVRVPVRWINGVRPHCSSRTRQPPRFQMRLNEELQLIELAAKAEEKVLNAT
ncbi:MAG: hypothetical protein RDU20_11845 [Desulfomonilaceae bacterium]|nr:hypothetical protein [Desulfomonilaceae bacterium]